MKFILMFMAAVAATCGRGESAAEQLAAMPETDLNAVSFSTGHTDPLRVRGVVRNAFPDEVDPGFTYLILESGGRNVPVSVHAGENVRRRLYDTIGSEVEVGGVLRTTSDIVSRAFLGQMICVNGPEYIRVIRRIPDPFSVPELQLDTYNLPSELAAQGRRRVCGRVLAVWGETEALLKTERGRPVRLSFPTGAELPAYDSEIEAVGDVETDTFNVHLTLASWRSSVSTNAHERTTVQALDVNELFEGRAGLPANLYPTVYNGQVLRLRGTVRSISDLKRGCFVIEKENYQITVDASALAEFDVGDLECGCTVDVTGTCILNADKWRETDVYPRVRNFFIIPNLPDDIAVVARPPWLTPTRMSLIVLATLSALAFFFVYNRILWLRAFRRGRMLSKETLARAEADMRTRERTRLAVELHDSLVQSLAGVIMELDTARRSAPAEGTVDASHVLRAEQMLKSCHAELRNCLWDLRSEALEMKDMKSAIERTLVPHVKGVALDIRFNVARVRIADNTAYMILRAIRELVLNGIRHGHADRIRVAGAIDGDRLLISVRDNGCGFDPDLAPGITDGHFGLEGIRERLRNLSGTFEISSEPGKGTRSVLTIPVPKGEIPS